jgi:hypothetical protein
MSERLWSLTHRQLMSAVIALALPSGAAHPQPLRDLGYDLVSLELPMVDIHSRQYQLDVLLANDNLNLSLLIECKTWAGTVKADQIERYMATTGIQVIQQSGITTPSPRTHRADILFVVSPGVERVVVDLVAACSSVAASGWGLVRVVPTGIEAVHDELSDAALSQSLDAGWEIDIERLPLERLPYESDAPRWELADAVLQTIFSFFATGRREFGIDDVCSDSNGLWAFLAPQHGHIRERVRDEVRTLRRTALSGWISVVATGGGREERWRFSRAASTGVRIAAAFAARHHRYVSILRQEGRNPVRNDFVEVAPEQLSFAFIVDEAPGS